MIKTQNDALPAEKNTDPLTLTFENAALLWCMRMWVSQMKQGVNAEPEIRGVLIVVSFL